jgi:hypothetical protein
MVSLIGFAAIVWELSLNLLVGMRRVNRNLFNEMVTVEREGGDIRRQPARFAAAIGCHADSTFL